MGLQSGMFRRINRSSFKTRLILLAALGVSLPALATCIILGMQLDRQARSLFASGLQSNLKTFSLLVEGMQRNTLDGVRRAASDNTVQVTVELQITSQLTDYLTQQAGLIGLDFMAAFDRNGQPVATAGEASHQKRAWRLAALGSVDTPCTVKEGVELQLVACDGTTYMVSVAPILRNRAVLGAASTRNVSWLGFMAGGIPVPAPELLTALEEHQLGIPLVWANDTLLHAGKLKNAPEIPPDTQVNEYEVDSVPYLGAATALPIGAGRLRLGLLTPLAPLNRAVLSSVGTVAMIGAFAVLVTLLFISVLAGRMLRPISELRDGALRIGQGDFSHRISVASGDEFEALAGQFNEMSAKLQGLYEELENKVAERTLELSESLEQQTATAEVLKVISRSAFDLDTVLDTLVKTSVRLCSASRGVIWLRTDDNFAVAAFAGHSNDPDPIGWTLPPVPGNDAITIAQTAAANGDIINVADVAADPAYHRSDGRNIGGQRAAMAVPMKRGGRTEGVILLSRSAGKPFTDRQVDLVRTLADQAVIALENVRLIDEVKSRSRELAQSRLRRFLAPQVAELLLATGESDAGLESHRCEVTVLFCDLRGFTAFAESAEPEEVMTVLREYHAALGELIFRFQGTLERFVGDGLLVVFNDPIPVPDHGAKAVRMAVEMRERMQELSAQWSRYGHRLGFGIGIAQGYATVGPIGFDQRLDYSVIGSIPNLASRLCDQARPGQILVSQRIYVAISSEAEMQPVGELSLKGFQNPVPAYEVIRWTNSAE